MKRGSMVRRLTAEAKREIEENPWYRTCARTDDLKNCRGRITIDHAVMYAGHRIDDTFGLVPVCEYHHLGDGFNRRKNTDIAMSRATEREREKYPRLKWNR